MSKRLIDENRESLFSPLLDLVMNGLGALILILALYVYTYRLLRPDPLKFLETDNTINAVSGNAFFFTFPATGGCGARRFSIIDGKHPGLQLERASGTLYGNPRLQSNTTGTSEQYSLKVRVEAGKESDERSFLLKIFPAAVPLAEADTPLRLLSPTNGMPSARVGSPYEFIVGAKGGNQPYVWVASGLPGGLNMGTNTGRISGKPVSSGEYPVVISASYSQGQFRYGTNTFMWQAGRDSTTIVLRVLPPAQLQLKLPDGRVKRNYSGGAVLPELADGERFVWRLTPPVKITWLRTSVGQVFGQPDQPGVVQLACDLVKGNQTLAQASGQFRVLPESAPVRLVRSEKNLPVARVGSDYEVVLGSEGGMSPVRWKTDGLPAGMSCAEGRLYGRPQSAGNQTVYVEATDAYGEVARNDYRLNVLAPLQHQFASNVGRVGEPFAASVYVNGLAADEQVRWDLPQGDKGYYPSGNSLVVRPEHSGVQRLDYTIVHGTNELARGTGQLKILDRRPAPTLTEGSLSVWAGKPFRHPIPMVGLVEPITTVAFDPALSGIQFVGGMVEGKLSKPGREQIAYRVTDALGVTLTNRLAFRVCDPSPIRITVLATNIVPLGRRFQWLAPHTGGDGPIEWRYSGPPINGLSFQDGILSGVLTNRQTWEATLSAKDLISGAGDTRRIVFAGLPVETSLPRITTAALAAGTPGDAYNVAFAAEGGVGQYAWKFGGDLPDGLRWTPNGISGTPTSNSAGTWNLMAQAVDVMGQVSEEVRLDLKILAPWPGLALRAADRIVARQNEPVLVAVEAFNCLGPVRWRTEGLPPGMAFTNGIIYGLSKATGDYKTTITASDNRGVAVSKSIELSVSKPAAP